MTETKPGADELRIRSILRSRGVGPDAPTPTTLPMPTPRPRDWLDDILNTDPTPKPEEEPAEPPPDPFDTEPKPHPKPRKPRARTEQQDRARQSLIDATAHIPRRIRWLTYHATAACAGWWLGWVSWATGTAAWYAQGHWTTPSAWVLYGLGGCACGLYRRSRVWAWPFAWAAAVPVSSIVVGVLLYGTTA